MTTTIPGNIQQLTDAQRQDSPHQRHTDPGMESAGHQPLPAADGSGDPSAEDSVEQYFACITTCSIDDGECITVCTEELRASH